MAGKKKLTDEEFAVISKITAASHMDSAFDVVQKNDNEDDFFDYEENKHFSLSTGLRYVAEGFSDTYDNYHLTDGERKIFIDLLTEFNIPLPSENSLYPKKAVPLPKSKQSNLTRASKLLTSLFKDLSLRPITVRPLDKLNKEIIVVTIGESVYKINVECENIYQMVKSVIDAVILKL